MEVPVYLFTGFLESGKTNFINDTFQHDFFEKGSKTLLIVCEEGVEEYDDEFLKEKNVTKVVVEDEDDFNGDLLKCLNAKYKPTQVVVEYNGMWSMDQILDTPIPKNWVLVQIIATINYQTFDSYLANMRSVIMEQVKYAQLVVFNRCEESAPEKGYSRTIKALNRRAQIVYERMDGSSIPVDEASMLPYDRNQNELEIIDEDFGIWYMDAMENPGAYEGKTVTFVGMVVKPEELDKDAFIPGRFAMTCCEDDMAFVGFMCKSENASEFHNKDWVKVTAVMKEEFVKEYEGNGPVLYAKSIEKVAPPKETVVYF